MARLAEPSLGQMQPIELGPQLDDLAAEVVRGLAKPVKELPCQLFYDERGCALFDQICALPEYYLTRTETALLERHADEIADRVGPRCVLVEFGSGSGAKTRILLDALPEPHAYIPLDLATDQLLNSASRIADAYPELKVVPINADFTRPLDFPPLPEAEGRRFAFFPGSTIGNLHPEQAVDFLRRVRALVEPDGALLVGVDLKKDPRLLHAAYNDRAGVTARFNLNLLAHINRRFGTDFRPERFVHEARYNEAAGRIEMYLISRVAQTVQLAGKSIGLDAGEAILTELSYKYDLVEFGALATQGGFETDTVWTDPHGLFSTHFLWPILNP